MNIFSFAGDLLHLTSIVIILLKIYTLQSCKGQRQADRRTDSTSRHIETEAHTAPACQSKALHVE